MPSERCSNCTCSLKNMAVILHIQYIVCNLSSSMPCIEKLHWEKEINTPRATSELHLNVQQSINSLSVWTARPHSPSSLLSLCPSPPSSAGPHTRPSIQRPSSCSHSSPPRCWCRARADWVWSVRGEETPLGVFPSASRWEGIISDF